MALVLSTIGNTALEKRPQRTSTDVQALDFADLSVILAEQHVDVYSDLNGREKDILFAKREWLKAVHEAQMQLARGGKPAGLERAVEYVRVLKPRVGAELATAGKKGKDARTLRNARAWLKELGKKRGRPDWENWKALARKWAGKRPTAIDPDFLRDVMALYLDPWCPDLASCVRKIARKFRVSGWEEAICTYEQLKHYVKTRISASVLNKYRGGREDFANKSKGYVARETEGILPGDVWFVDHRIADFFVKLPHPEDDTKWEAKRPYVTAIRDAATGYIICMKIYADQAPSHVMVLQALQEAIFVCGMIPAKVWYCDNGSDFLKYGLGRPATLKNHKGDLLHDGRDEPYRYSVFQQLRTTVKRARAYNGKEKPVERDFGSMSSDFDKTQHGYCGRDTKSRPDIRDTYNGKITSLPSVQQVLDELDDWIRNEHHQKTRDGKTIQQLWENRELQTERALSERDLFFALLLPRRNAAKVTRTSIGHTGVKHAGWMYSHISLLDHQDEWVMIKTYWGTPTARRKGKEVPLYVFVFTLDDVLICAAPADPTANMIAETEAEKAHLGRIQHLINHVAARATDEFEEHTGSRRITSPRNVLAPLPGHSPRPELPPAAEEEQGLQLVTQGAPRAARSFSKVEPKEEQPEPMESTAAEREQMWAILQANARREEDADGW